MNDPSSRRRAKIWLCVEIACLAFLACLLLGKGVLPGWRHLNSDFPNYYVVARLMHEGYNLDRVYDWIWLQRIKDHWNIDQPLVAFAGLTPLSALPMLPVAGLAALTAKRLWIVANLLFLFGTAEALHRVTGLGRRRIWILSLLAILPLRSSFALGQMHILVLFLLALAYLFRSQARGIACGACIALAGALKVYPLLFVAYFAWKKQWREAVSIVCATAALVAIGYVCMGGHVMRIYLTQILPRSMQGEAIDPYNVRAASAAALLHRLFICEPGLNPAPVWNRPLLYAIVYPLWQAAILFPTFLGMRPSAHDRDTEKLEWAIFLLALLVLSPVPSSYHFVVLILPAVLAADVLIRRQQHLQLASVILLYWLMCSVTISPAGAGTGFSFLTMLAFFRLWIGLLLWLVLVLYLCHESRVGIGLRAGLLFAAVCLFWIAGFAGYRRHFAHLDEDIRARMNLPIHPLLTTGVHPGADGFVATAMMPVGYRIVDNSGQAVWPVPETDQLSSAAVAGHSPVFVEFADSSGSRILLRDAPAFNLQDAEYPALSPDGLSLAYIREEKGRGRLRVARLASSRGAPVVTGDEEVVSDPYDVRDAMFTPSGSVLFAARAQGRTNIYQVTPGSTPAVLISGPEEVDAPAVSPGGRQLAFRKLIHNRWQLMTMDLGSRRQRQLTFGDCNVSAPAWLSESTIAYGSDCGRGLGLAALASMDVGH